MNKSTGILTIIFILLLLFLPNISGQDNKISSTNYIPVNDLSGTGYIKEWTVFGPFSNKISSEPFPDGSYQEGLFQDNLTDLDISEDLRWSNDDFKELVLAISKNNDLTISKSSSTEYGVVDFLKIFEPMDNKSAYALCFINSKKDEQYNFLFGSDDGAKVWVNGKLVHKKDAARGIRHREDHFSGLLNKGSNSILIKVTQYTRGWGFVLEALDQNSYKLYKTEEAMKKGRI